jgi:hypothetical protein
MTLVMQVDVYKNVIEEDTKSNPRKKSYSTDDNDVAPMY